MNHGTMLGMFWGGVLMSLPPVLLGIGIAFYIYRQHRAATSEEKERAPK